MLRKNAFIPVLAFLWLLPAVGWSTPEDRKIYEKSAPAIVGIECVAPLPVRNAEGETVYRGPWSGYFGTGTLISPNGHVLTSTTVVPPGARDIRIHLSEGGIREGTLVQTRVDLEIALVKIDGEKLPHVPVGSSQRLELGERVYTIGNVYGSIQRHRVPSMSVGTFSGRYSLAEASDPQATYRGEVLETTAGLNPGLDGGPLLSSRGVMVGLLSLNYSKTRFLGVGVPMEKLLPVLGGWMKGENELLRERKVSSVPDRTWQSAARSVVMLNVTRSAGKTQTPEPQRRGRRRPPPRTPPVLLRPDEPVTGIGVGPDGKILTSYWNVSGEVEKIEVTFPDGSRSDVRMIGFDRTRDIALLQAEKPARLPVIRWNNRIPDTGEPVFVVGRSPGEGATMTEGIVSAVGRMRGSLLQIDAPVNYGNTGGVVLNEKGEPIGIAALLSAQAPWGQNSGIGFCVPASQVETVLAELSEGKNITRVRSAFLGMRPGAEGNRVEVAEVLQGSAAERAGWRNGDVLLSFDGEEIRAWEQVVRIIRAHRAQDKVSFQLKRGGGTVRGEVTLGESPFR